MSLRPAYVGTGCGGDDAENLLVPLVDNITTSSEQQDAMNHQQIRTSEPRDV